MKLNSIISVLISIASLVLCGVAFTNFTGKDPMFLAMDIIMIVAIMGFAVVAMLLKNEKYRIYTAIPMVIMSMCIFIPSISGWRIAVFVIFLICYGIMLVYLFLSKTMGSSLYIFIMQIFLLVYSILELAASTKKYYTLFYISCIIGVVAVGAYLFDYLYENIVEFYKKKSTKNEGSKGNE